MDKTEIIARIKKNKNKKTEAIILISDFLEITKAEAQQIYLEEFGEDE